MLSKVSASTGEPIFLLIRSVQSPIAQATQKASHATAASCLSGAAVVIMVYVSRFLLARTNGTLALLFEIHSFPHGLSQFESPVGITPVAIGTAFITVTSIFAFHHGAACLAL